MAYVVRKIVDMYFYLNDEISDPRVKDWLFMSSPFSTTVILVLYLNFVLKWGPRFMRDRKPFNLDTLMIVYNIVQIIACFYLVFQGMYYAYANNYSLTCEPIDYSNDPTAVQIAHGVHTYFLLKISDLIDTIFFVLRKKDRQVSFLHLYHHTGMVVLTWVGTKWLAGGHSIFTGFINSIIHIVMYSYYLVTAFSPRHKNNVWWKKYITQMQIIQFFMIMSHWTSLLFTSCGYPTWPVPIMITQNFFMLALFGDFYRKSYLTVKSAPAKIDINGNGNGHIISDANHNVIQTNGKLNVNGALKNGINESTFKRLTRTAE